jgi:hypothetical protein
VVHVCCRSVTSDGTPGISNPPGTPRVRSFGRSGACPKQLGLGVAPAGRRRGEHGDQQRPTVSGCGEPGQSTPCHQQQRHPRAASHTRLPPQLISNPTCRVSTSHCTAGPRVGDALDVAAVIGSMTRICTGMQTFSLNCRASKREETFHFCVLSLPSLYGPLILCPNSRRSHRGLRASGLQCPPRRIRLMIHVRNVVVCRSVPAELEPGFVD